MRFKRWLILTLVFAFGGASMALANDAFEWFKAKSIQVVVNDGENYVDGLLTDKGRTYLPLKAIGDTLQALVTYEESTGTVRIYKPNVHMFLLEEPKDRTFGEVLKDGKYDFKVFAQVDNLTTKVSSLKLIIEDPYGTGVYSETIQMDKDSVKKESFWFKSSVISLNFKYAGNYKIKFLMKLIGQDSTYSLVSEKTLYSKDPKK